MLEGRRNSSTLFSKLSGKKVLVTGGAGFLGSWVCEALLRYGAVVTAFDNFSSGQEKNIKHLGQNPNFTFVKGDVRSPPSFGRLDYVLHLASRADPFEFERHPLDILETNSTGTMRILQAALDSKADRFLLASTSECYGDPDIVPTPETYHGKVSITGPRACYDESKRFAEAYTLAFAKEHGMDVRIARIFNTYGPRLRADGVFYGRAVSNFILQALSDKPMTVFGSGEQTRSFCYVTDTVDGLLRVLLNENAKREIFNVGNDHEITILELAGMIKKMVKSSSPIAFKELPRDDPKRRKPDLTKAKTLLGYEPRVPLADGIRETINWFRGAVV